MVSKVYVTFSMEFYAWNMFRNFNISRLGPVIGPAFSMEIGASTVQYTICKIAYFAGQMEVHNSNKVNGFLASRDYIYHS